MLAELALTLARLLGRGGNRVGAVLYDTGQTRIVPPGTGRNQALRIGRELDRAAATPAGATTDLAAMLDAVASMARRRCLVVVVSDFIGSGDWERPLMRLAHRNEVVAMRVVDAADDALPEVGLIVVEDVETGEQVLIDSSDPLFRARFADGVDERQADLRPGCGGPGAAAPGGHRRDLVDHCSAWSPRPSGGERERSREVAVSCRPRCCLVLGRAGRGRARRRRWCCPGAAVDGPRRGRDLDRRPSGGRQLGAWFTVGGLVVLAIAVAGPLASIPVGREAGTVIVAMDVSNSMGATDVAPTRFAAAKAAAIAFVNAQPDNVDIGVVGFDQGAITSSLTSADRAATVTAIKALRVSGGTSLGAAILASLTTITGKTGGDRR